MKRTICIFSLATLLIIGISGEASALKLWFQDPNQGVLTIIEDNGSEDDNPILGVVTYVGPVGSNWGINVTTGISKPIVGDSNVAQLDIISDNLTFQGAGELILAITDTDFVLPADQSYSMTNKIGGVAQDTIAAAGHYDFFNNEFNPGQAFARNFTDLPNDVFSGGGVFADTAIAELGPIGGSLFSLTEIIYLSHASTGVTSFDKTLTVYETSVPEPATMLLLGTGIIGLAGIRKRFKK